MKKFKSIICKECERIVRVKLYINCHELLDGYHGECPHCGWLFEPIKLLVNTTKGELQNGK